MGGSSSKVTTEQTIDITNEVIQSNLQKCGVAKSLGNEITVGGSGNILSNITQSNMMELDMNCVANQLSDANLQQRIAQGIDAKSGTASGPWDVAKSIVTPWASSKSRTFSKNNYLTTNRYTMSNQQDCLAIQGDIFNRISVDGADNVLSDVYQSNAVNGVIECIMTGKNKSDFVLDVNQMTKAAANTGGKAVKSSKPSSAWLMSGATIFIVIVILVLSFWLSVKLFKKFRRHKQVVPMEIKKVEGTSPLYQVSTGEVEGTSPVFTGEVEGTSPVFTGEVEGTSPVFTGEVEGTSPVSTGEVEVDQTTNCQEIMCDIGVHNDGEFISHIGGDDSINLSNDPWPSAIRCREMKQYCTPPPPPSPPQQQPISTENKTSQMLDMANKILSNPRMKKMAKGTFNMLRQNIN
jgi:hypothetical protein